MRAEKKSRWRADVATPFAPPQVVGGRFPLRCLAIAFGEKQVRRANLKSRASSPARTVPQGELVVQSESFSKEHILRMNSVGVMAGTSNWSHDPYRTFQTHGTELQR
jgi:hypothetical protein